MAAARGITLDLAEFVAGLRFEDVPEDVRDVLRKVFVDAVGCGLFGFTLPWGRMVSDYALEQGGPAQASLWGAQRKVSCGHAALAIGAAIHGFDFDDHHRAKIHAGAPVIAAAITLAEALDADGERLVTAMAAGFETMTRVSLATNPGAARLRGWHLTGTCGTFGAAAAAASLLGLDRDTTASALGLAGTQSAGLWAFNADGAMSKRLHPGHAAQCGLKAADLARRGFTGPRYILEAEDGGFLKVMSDEPRPDEVTEDLGRAWRTEGVCFKPYACCGSNHACIDAALGIMRDEGVAIADIDRVVAGISRVVLTQTGFPYRVSTVLNAQMSLRYNVAVAVIDGQALLDQFTEERIRDPRVVDLAQRVDVEIDPEMDAVYPRLYAGVITVNTRDGRRLRRRVDYSKGMPENPMSLDEVRQKFRSLAGLALGSSGAEEALAAVDDIRGVGSVRTLQERLGAVQLTGDARAVAHVTE